MATPYVQGSSDTPLPTNGRDGETAISLLRRMMDEITTLFRQELALASAEIMQALTRLLAGSASVATGGAVLFAGFLVLLASAVLGLAKVVEPWLAALIIGLVVGVVGYLMVFAGLKTLKTTEVKPRLSPESLRQDKDVLMRKTS